MSTLPREDGRSDLPFEPNPAGSRIFRVTDRTIDSRTRLIIADTPEDACAAGATQINMLAHEVIHEVVECVEYRPFGWPYTALPVTK